MNLILKNPYRTIGLLIGATAKEQERQIRRLKQFIEAEQKPDSDFSFAGLGVLERNIEHVNEAASKLNLDNDKMLAALFWFFKGSEITDEPAFDALKEFDLDSACSIWEKLAQSDEVTKRNASAINNLSTIYLSGVLDGTNTAEAIYEKGITLKIKFLESDFALTLKELATDETYKISKKDLQILFLNQLQIELEKNGGISNQKFIEILNNCAFTAKEDFLKSFVQKPITQIEKKIEAAKSQRKANKANAAKIGKELFENVSTDLNQLKSILNSTNLKYTTIADKASDEILQCGIDYFLFFRDSTTDPSVAAMDLFKKAKVFATGNITRQRCQENTENLQEWINEKPERKLQEKAGNEISFIIDYLNLMSSTLKNNGRYPRGYDDPYSKLPLNEQPQNIISSNQSNDSEMPFVKSFHSISDVSSLIKTNEFNINLFRLGRDSVKECKPRFEKIKLEVGASNEIYQKLSNDMAALALSCLINYVNNSPAKTSYGTAITSPDVDEHVINAMNAIGDLDMSFEIRKRYNEQRQSLNSLRKNVKRSSSSSSGGCYIATMAYGDYNHPQVMILRQFRDDVLAKTILGKGFIQLYYYFSPKLVEMLENNEAVNSFIRKTLNKFIKLIQK